MGADCFKELFGHDDNNACITIDITNIHTKPLEMQAKYANLYYKQHCEDRQFLSKLPITILSPQETFSKWTITDVGNIAYLALYAPVPHRWVQKELLNQYAEWRLNNILGRKLSHNPLFRRNTYSKISPVKMNEVDFYDIEI